MPLIGKFGKGAGTAPATASKPAAKAKPAGPPKSRWDGYSGGTDRTPMLVVGDYVLEVVSTELKPSENPQKPNRETFICHVRVVECDGDGATPVDKEMGILCLLDTNGGQQDFFRVVRAAAGYETDEEFAEACAEAGSTTGFFLEACCGNVTPFSPDGTNPIVGAKFIAFVTRGNEVMNKAKEPTGDYYRSYRFEPHES